MNNEQLRVRAGKMPLSLCTKVIQPMQHFCIKNVACNDTLGAKRYRSFLQHVLLLISSAVGHSVLKARGV